MIKMILFDLDGTLLPMDQEIFAKAYFKHLTSMLVQHGYEQEKLIKAVWEGTSSMVKNDGSYTNEEVFWKKFSDIFGDDVLNDKPLFEEFYRTEFQKLSEICGFIPEVKENISKLKEKGYRLVLATNPIFPSIATESRIRWAGLNPHDFEFYTTYENSYYCKPNPKYYIDILERLGCKPDECIMVGNDVEEDMVAQTIGMEVFLLTDCLINKNDKDITKFRHGSFNEFCQNM